MSEILKSFVAAVVGGGLWNIYLHWRERTFEKKLLIDLETSSKILDDRRFVFVAVKLTNAGKIKLQAKPIGENESAYKDQIEELKFSCSLQVRRVDAKKLAGETLLDWYRCPALEKVSGIPQEIDLLDEYALPDEDYKTVFWLEPGEAVHLAAPLVLNPGHYLLKVSFYGTDPNKDFWSRLDHLSLE